MTDVFIDDRFAGTVENVAAFTASVKEERKTGKLPGTLNVFYDELHDELHLEISKGRVRRPLIVVRMEKACSLMKFTSK